MNSKVGWLLVTFFLIAVFAVLGLVFGWAGVLIGILVDFVFIVILYQLNKGRARNLEKALEATETLVAKGNVSESTYDEMPAILARGMGGGYRVLVADKRGSQVVLSVAPVLKTHKNPYDLKRYLEFTTDKGILHFAPHNSPLAPQQPPYAEEVLKHLLGSGLAVTETPGARDTAFA